MAKKLQKSGNPSESSAKKQIRLHGLIEVWLSQNMTTELAGDTIFSFWNGERIVYPGQSKSAPSLTITINHPAVISLILQTGNLLIAMDMINKGFMDFEGDIDALIDLYCHLYGRPFMYDHSDYQDFLMWCKNLPPFDSDLSGLVGRENSNWEQMAVNSPQRDKAVVQYHYDISNDFYKLWLDPMMLYSCAHFESESMSLDDAQKAKLDIICRKLRLQKGEQYLDIGCGWGSLLKWAVTRYGVKGHGITLSQEQFEFNKKWIEEEGLAGHVTVELKDYRELPKSATYDKISSIGMIEHVGVANYSTYFKSALNCLKPNGLFLNHGIALNQLWQPEVTFILKYIFPDAQCPPITTYLQFAKDSGFEIIDLDAWRPHYAKTLRAWASNLDNNKDAAQAIVGNRIKMWQIYLRFCAQGFENGTSGVYQMLLKRAADNQWNLPLTRHNWLC